MNYGLIHIVHGSMTPNVCKWVQIRECSEIRGGGAGQSGGGQKVFKLPEGGTKKFSALKREGGQKKFSQIDSIMKLALVSKK